MKNNNKLKIVYFPLEQKYSIWDENYNLIKEWFNTREQAQEWINNNLKNI